MHCNMVGHCFVAKIYILSLLRLATASTSTDMLLFIHSLYIYSLFLCICVLVDRTNHVLMRECLLARRFANQRKKQCERNRSLVIKNND